MSLHRNNFSFTFKINVMKKILLTLVLLISLKLAANCQSQLGIIGGVNIPKVHTDEYLKIMNGSPSLRSILD